MKSRIGLIFLSLLWSVPFCSAENPAVNYIQSVVVDYAQPNIVYVASRGQGLFKSVDYGESWNLICEAAGNRNFNVVVQDPLTPERLLAGGQQSGLLLSPDRGETWQVIGLPGESINEIAIDRTNPKRVFVLAGRGVYSNQNIEKEKWVLCFDYGRYMQDSMHMELPKMKGRDGKIRRFGYGRFKKIAVSPFRPNTIVVGANWEGGFFRSDDGGKSWRHETLSGIFRRVDVIYFHPTDPDVFYVGTHHQGMFKTYNFGKSWTPLSDGLEPQIRSPYYGAYLISGFAPDRTDPDTFYTGSDYSNWKTSDGGEHWYELDRTLSCEFVRGMAVDPKHPNIVYAGSNVGMYKSMDGGRHWRAINTGFREIDVLETISAVVGKDTLEFALAEHYPFVFRRARGEQWMASGWRLPECGVKTVSDIYFEEVTQELVLVSDNGDFVSRDGGYRWHGERPALKYLPVKTAVKEWKPAQLDSANNYLLEIDLQGDVFFTDSLVDSLYRKPPYISLQVVEVGYPYNKTVPCWSQNVDDCLKATVEVPRSAVESGKTYWVYAEVRDFQANYKTAFAKIEFGEKATIPVTMQLQKGFCLKRAR